MRHKFIHIFIICLLIIGLVSMTSAAEMKKLAQTGFQFLKVDVGARAAGMGGAFVAVTNDANSLFWNPAGITQAKKGSFSISQTSWIADINQIGLAAVLPVSGIGHFGVSVVTVNYGDIPRTIISDSEAGYIQDGTYTPGGVALGLGYAKQFTDKLSIGGQIKYASESLGSSTIRKPNTTETQTVDNELSALAFDIGTLYYTGYKDLRLSMSIRNFSQDIEYETESFQMPLTFSIGLAMDVLSVLDVSEMHKLTLAVDAIHPRDYSERLHFGAEYMFRGMLALRAGYKVNYDEEGLAAGFGLRHDFGGVNFNLDYSYTDMGTYLGNVNRFSLSGSF